MATAIIGVKFGGWGIALDKTKIKIKITEKLFFFINVKYFNKF